MLQSLNALLMEKLVHIIFCREDHSKEGQFKPTARGLGMKKQASPQPSRKPANTPVSTSAPTKSSPLPSRAISAILGQKRDQQVTPVTSIVKTKDGGTKKPAVTAAEKASFVASISFGVVCFYEIQLSYLVL